MKQTHYENYFVNEQGDVFSTKFNKVRKIKLAITADGYLQISISNNGKAKSILVHRLIAETFIPNPQKKIEVNHKNGIKNDNRVENLEWVTHKENIKHAYAIGLSIGNIGKNHPLAKLNEKQVLEIRKLYFTKKYTLKVLGKMFNVSIPQISSIINNKSWKHI